MENLKYIIESLLFVAEEPLTINNMKKVLSDVENKDIREALAELSKEYETRKGGFYLNEVAGGYQLRTRPDYREWITKLIQPSPLRLSKPALETLAIIAYRQPIIRAEIEHIRGVDSGGIVRMLMERKLIKVLGRKDVPGRPLIYTTTKHFLEVFNLKDLKDLPTPKEIEELGQEMANGAPESWDEIPEGEDADTITAEGEAVTEEQPQEETGEQPLETAEAQPSEETPEPAAQEAMETSEPDTPEQEEPEPPEQDKTDQDAS